MENATIDEKVVQKKFRTSLGTFQTPKFLSTFFRAVGAQNLYYFSCEPEIITK